VSDGGAGMRVVLIPARAPNANAYAERFVRSIEDEFLDRIIPVGEHHFRRAVAEFACKNALSRCKARLYDDENETTEEVRR
jgi:hypothetical protein